MDAVTYPHQVVKDFIEKRLVPLKIHFKEKPHASDFNVEWTPTLLILDGEGREHHRSVGYQPPEEMLAFMLFGMGKLYFNDEDYGLAIQHLDELLAKYPKTNPAAEAVYYRGVARFKKTGSRQHLKTIYQQLLEQYPESLWTKRAEPYKTIE